MKEIYLDNASATPADPRVIRAVARAMRETGNPESFNDAGRRARQLLEDARAGIARFLNARAEEVLLFHSASEANAAAIRGVVGSAGARRHLVTTAVEHRSVLGQVQRHGTKATVVPVDGQGRVAVGDIADAIGPRTALVSVMYANNEVGTIQPIKAIAKAVREYRRRTRSRYPYLHVDASQAAAYLPMDVQALGVDLLTVNGAKIHGPHHAAVLYARRGIRWEGNGSRDGAAAAGLAEALRLIRSTDAGRVAALRDRAISGILAALPDARLNGPVGAGRIANNISISIPGVASEELLLELDAHGIRAGAGAACTAHSVEPSHVLRAMGVPRRYLGGTLRISLSRMTTVHDITRLLDVLPKAVAAIRRRHA